MLQSTHAHSRGATPIKSLGRPVAIRSTTGGLNHKPPSQRRSVRYDLMTVAEPGSAVGVVCGARCVLC
eukprot:6534937-Alexandrium_andersonii.AAC.1